MQSYCTDIPEWCDNVAYPVKIASSLKSLNSLNSLKSLKSLTSLKSLNSLNSLTVSTPRGRETETETMGR